MAQAPAKGKGGKPKMISFSQLENEVSQIVEELSNHTGLRKDIVHNIVSYAKCLMKEGTSNIDEQIFTAQMAKYFEITDKTMLGRIYTVGKDPKQAKMNVTGYCRVVCTMLCDDLDLQARFVFSVYDVNHDENLSQVELFQLLKACVISTETDEMDEAESVNDLVEIVMGATDLDRNGSISLDEYIHLVHKDILLLQLLGKCLPNEMAKNAFLAKMTGPNPVQIRHLFAKERKHCLREIDEDAVKESLYPFKLELP